MRVTNNMMMNSMSVSLQKKTQSILSLTEKIATGKKISKPSDDPLGMARAMDYRDTISQVAQYMENISRGKTKIEVMENILEEAEDLVISAKQIATDQSMGKLETRSTAADQVRSIYEQLFNIANSDFENSYLFAGHLNTAAPYIMNADGIDGNADDELVAYVGDQGDQEIIIGKNNHVKINATGDEVFGDPDGAGPEVDVFTALYGLIEGLENTDLDAGTVQIQASVELLKSAEEQINSVRTRNAGTYDRLESSEAYWDNFKTAMEDQLSAVEDADLTQAAVDLQNAELIYETSMALSKEIIQNSLLSFLR